MKRFGAFTLRSLMIFVIVTSVMGGLLSYFSGMPLWGACLVVAFALLVNGFVAEVEDGAFDNDRADASND